MGAIVVINIATTFQPLSPDYPLAAEFHSQVADGNLPTCRARPRVLPVHPNARTADWQYARQARRRSPTTGNPRARSEHGWFSRPTPESHPNRKAIASAGR